MNEAMVIGTQDAEVARVMIDGARDELNVMDLHDNGSTARTPVPVKPLTGVTVVDLARCTDKPKNQAIQTGRPHDALVELPSTTTVGLPVGQGQQRCEVLRAQRSSTQSGYRHVSRAHDGFGLIK